MPKVSREDSLRFKCQVCGLRYGLVAQNENKRFVQVTQHIDHLIPRRWLTERDVYPHNLFNLLSVCCLCHGKKKTIEDKLFRGDAIGWLNGLNQIGFPVDRIMDFAVSQGLEEFKKLACKGMLL